MLWKRCLIILFILLQPLRGFAEAQAAFCGFPPPSSQPAVMQHQHHAHHHGVDSSSGVSAKTETRANNDHGMHAGQHNHGKSCGSCCQACGPALSANTWDSEVSAPIAPEIHRLERTPPSPVENHIRPPIA